MLALSQSVLAGHRQLAHHALFGVLSLCAMHATTNLITTAGAGDSQTAAGCAAKHWGQIALPTFRSKAIQTGPNELHERCLASLIGTVEQRHAIGQRVDR